MQIRMTPALKVDKDLYTRKGELLAYFRSRAEEALSTIVQTYGVKEYKERANAINKAIATERDRLATQLRQLALREKWSNDTTLPNMLLLAHCANVVMLEGRNSVWPYEYMTFSRRIGEMWEPFCSICFEYPLRKRCCRTARTSRLSAASVSKRIFKTDAAERLPHLAYPQHLF